MKAMLFVCQRLSFCALGLLLLCGFEVRPDCASDDARKTVIAIAKEHPPAQMLSVAEKTWTARQKQEIEKECGKQYTEECTRPALETLAQKQRLMGHDASYKIDNIRMTDRNVTTGAVSCAADLHITLQEYWGSADEPITYLVERYLGKGGGFNVTVYGLH